MYNLLLINDTPCIRQDLAFNHCVMQVLQTQTVVFTSSAANYALLNVIKIRFLAQNKNKVKYGKLTRY